MTVPSCATYFTVCVVSRSMSKQDAWDIIAERTRDTTDSYESNLTVQRSVLSSSAAGSFKRRKIRSGRRVKCKKTSKSARRGRDRDRDRDKEQRPLRALGKRLLSSIDAGVICAAGVASCTSLFASCWRVSPSYSTARQEGGKNNGLAVTCDRLHARPVGEFVGTDLDRDRWEEEDSISTRRGRLSDVFRNMIRPLLSFFTPTHRKSSSSEATVSCTWAAYPQE